MEIGSRIDPEEEKARIKAEIENKKAYIRSVDVKLMNKDFTKNAPEKIVRGEMEKKHIAEEQLAKLEEKLAKIG